MTKRLYITTEEFQRMDPLGVTSRRARFRIAWFNFKQGMRGR